MGLRQAGTGLTVTSPSPMAYKLLELTGFTRVLGVDRPSRPEVVPAQPQVPAPVEVPGAGGAYEDLALEPASGPDD